jgi:hypothetical protein
MFGMSTAPSTPREAKTHSNSPRMTPRSAPLVRMVRTRLGAKASKESVTLAKGAASGAPFKGTTDVVNGDEGTKMYVCAARVDEDAGEDRASASVGVYLQSHPRSEHIRARTDVDVRGRRQRHQ